MSTNSVLIAQRRGSPTGTSTSLASWEPLCPTIRVPIITGLTTTQEVPGGWQECEFRIPARSVRWAADMLIPYESQVWAMAGAERAFYGHIAQVTPDDQTGDLIVACDGAFRRLEDTRMRCVWSDGDLSAMPPARGANPSFTTNVDSNGDLILAVPNDQAGTGFTQGAFVAVDYWLFNESAGTRDAKKLDGWYIAIGSVGPETHQQANFDQHAALEVRIYGYANPGDNNPDLLQIFGASGTDRREVSDASSGQNTASWPSSTGYRMFRVGLYAKGAGNTNKDFVAKITSFNVSTRARVMGQRTVVAGTAAPLMTPQIATDVWSQRGYDISYLLQEESASTVSNQMVVGNINDTTGVGSQADNIAYTDWSSPGEIVSGMQAIDGYKVGMWAPTRNPPAGSITTAASNHAVNSWYRQPPELVYEAWNDLGTPNYIIRLARGAQWTPDGNPDELLSAAYTTYTTRSGRTKSVFVEDTDIENRQFEQGIHQAIDWTVEPAVGDATAGSLANQLVRDRRQPVLSGTLTLRADQPGSIELPGGGRFTNLWSLRPGVIRIVDAKGAKAGRVTAITVTAADGTNPTTAVLTVNNPSAQQLDLRLARIARNQSRKRTR